MFDMLKDHSEISIGENLVGVFIFGRRTVCRFNQNQKGAPRFGQNMKGLAIIFTKMRRKIVCIQLLKCASK